MILSAIAAMARNRVIGKDNKLPWHLPEELKFFRETTKGKILLMGRKTFESLGGKPLPGRPHIVITRQKDYKVDHPLVQVAHDIEQAVVMAKKMQPTYPEEVMILGGSEIYKQSLGLLDRLYLSCIDQDFDGDAYFPKFESEGLKLVKEIPHLASIPFVVKIFERA